MLLLKVREQAMTTLVEIYRHVGERFRVDVSKKDINTAKYDVITTLLWCLCTGKSTGNLSYHVMSCCAMLTWLSVDTDDVVSSLTTL